MTLQSEERLPDHERRSWRQRIFSGQLWRHPDFLKFWTGQTISVFGNQIRFVAIPLVAALTLEATALQLGVLTAAGRLPWLIFGLFIGVWIDRLRRRPVLIVADLLRALLLFIIPISAALDLLRIEILVAVAFFVGTLSIFFGLAYHSYVPSLVGRRHLVEGNSKLEISATVAQVGGPGLAGLLVQVLTAPAVILIDAISFLVSALVLRLIRTEEPEPAARESRKGFRAEIGEGLRYVFGNPVLRALVAGGGIHNFSTTMLLVVFVLYVTRDLGISPAIFGIILAVGSIGSLLGALVASRAGLWFGVGPAVIVAQFITLIGGMFYPLATSASVFSVALLMIGQAIWGFSRPILNVNQVSLRQGMTPDQLLGRMTASIRFIMWGVPPLGGLVGGILGSTIGLRETLVVVLFGELLSGVWYLLSPLRGISEQPEVQVGPAA